MSHLATTIPTKRISRKEFFPLLTSIDDKIQFNFAWYHQFSKNNEPFLRFNVLNHVCLLLNEDKRIKIDTNLFLEFKSHYKRLREIEPLYRFAKGVICQGGLMSWQAWAYSKNTLLEGIEQLAAKIELIILKDIEKIGVSDTIKDMQKTMGADIGLYDETEKELDTHEDH